VVILILQIGYIYYLFTGPHITAAANVASHFIVNNLLLFGFVLLWVRSFFWIGELLLVINFFNLSALYFRHPTTPLLIHLPVVSGPLAWNFIALLWCGAAMVNAHTLVARILANVAIWGILGYGLFFLVTYKDYTIGFNLSVLSAGMSAFNEDQNPVALLTNNSARGASVFHQAGCLSVDLRLCDYVRPLHCHSPHCHPGLSGKASHLRQEHRCRRRPGTRTTIERWGLDAFARKHSEMVVSGLK
jgi:hypothetical protein